MFQNIYYCFVHQIILFILFFSILNHYFHLESYFFFAVRDIFAEENRLSPPSSPRSNKFDNHRSTTTELLTHHSITQRISGTPPVRRFISSILGGDIPYGSRGHVLTQAQRKEYPPPASATTAVASTAVAQHYSDSKEPALDTLVPPKTPSPPIIEKDKEIVPETKPLNLKTPEPPRPEKRPSPPPAPESAVRCSVIQRVPATKSTEQSKAAKDVETKLPSLHSQLHPEPEQEHPIDYHIPKKRNEMPNGDEQERRWRDARRALAIKGRPLLSVWKLPNGGKCGGIMTAAAGHGRSGGGSQAAGTNQATGNSCGGSINFGGSAGGGSAAGGTPSSGGIGSGGVGGSGAGGGMGGRDGRSNYGPNSPPTGSLPPFCESLKGGQAGMHAYNAAANGNYIVQNAYNQMMATNLNMDCDTTQELTNLSNYSASLDSGNNSTTSSNNNNNSTTNNNNNNNSLVAKHYSMLHNAAYGIVLKDEQDLEYESKMDALNLNTNLLQNPYSGYDVSDTIMDMANGVDPLQFNATLTFSSPAEHALLDQLSDAVDLSSFLQRLPHDDQSSSGNDLNDLSSTPSLTPDSVSITPVDNSCLDSFPDQILLAGGLRNAITFDRNGYAAINTQKMYCESPPTYQQSREMHHALMQQQQQQQQNHHNQHQQQHLQNNNGVHQQMHSVGQHQQQQQQQHLPVSLAHSLQQQQQQHNNDHHHQLSLNTNCLNYDLDSHSNLSLPSPSSGSMDAMPETKPIIQSVSVKQEPMNGDIGIAMESKIVWRQRVSALFLFLF